LDRSLSCYVQHPGCLLLLLRLSLHHWFFFVLIMMIFSIYTFKLLWSFNL
jgi:hypothetical protein